MLGICYLLWHCIAVHMDTVLWSAMLHAVLCATQPLQPLHLVASPECPGLSEVSLRLLEVLLR